MIVVMKPEATKHDVNVVIQKAEQMKLKTHPIYGESRTVVALVGNLTNITTDVFEMLPNVLQAMRVQEPYKLASRIGHPTGSQIEIMGGADIGPIRFGGDEVIVMAGPCSVEGRNQIIESAIALKEAGAKILRGGAFKPRTSPYDFQGMGEEGLKYMAEAREITGMPIITEVMNVEQVPLVAEYADILQIGARNMQNFGLLQTVGKINKPVMLKRGISGMIKELLMCAEYIMSGGNGQVMLCERGIRTYETMTRNTFDLNAVPVLKQSTHLPIVADPSHGTGLRELVPSMSRAAVAAGADALIIEVHADPDKALSDGRQTLSNGEFMKLMESLRRVAIAVDRYIGEAPDELDLLEDELAELAAV